MDAAYIIDSHTQKCVQASRLVYALDNCVQVFVREVIWKFGFGDLDVTIKLEIQDDLISCLEM